MRNRARQMQCFAATLGLFDVEPYHMLHTLAVGDDLIREGLTDSLQSE
jgi:hypothetical protein